MQDKWEDISDYEGMKAIYGQHPTQILKRTPNMWMEKLGEEPNRGRNSFYKLYSGLTLIGKKLADRIEALRAGSTPEEVGFENVYAEFERLRVEYNNEASARQQQILIGDSANGLCSTTFVR